MNLTPGEKLELTRRRLAITQPQAAELVHGVSTALYRRWEHDATEGAPDVPVGDLTPSEWAWLQRRRAGLTLTELSDLFGQHRQWIHKVETGKSLNPEPLVEWWRRRLAEESTG